MKIETIMESDIFTVSLRLFLALICGGILGFERGRKRRPAGFRTYILVCLGAALAMMTNEYLFKYYGSGDPARMGAQVISGIGFLGAGTIIVTSHNKVMGLTTAAGLWAAACIGLALGIGYYSAALIGSGFIFVAMAALHKIDLQMTNITKIIHIYVEFANVSGISTFITYLREKDIHVTEMEMIRSSTKDNMDIGSLMTLKFSKDQDLLDIATLIDQAEGVTFIEET